MVRKANLRYGAEAFSCTVQGWTRWLFEIRFGPPATHDANVAEVAATISFERLDFRFIVRGYHLVPVQPKLPAIGHGVGQFNRP